jgi:membrane protease YdiL (CAAX protease family)
MSTSPLALGSSPPVHLTGRVASWAHTAVLLSIFVSLALAGGVAQARSHNRGLAAPRSNVALVYVSLIAAEWALVLYVRRGMRRTQTTITDLLGTSIAERRTLGADALAATLLWSALALIEVAWTHWRGPIDTGTVRPFLAHRPVEIILWIVLSISAGFAEEVVYRGYLQRQFAALTGSVSLALVMQAVVFGVSHGYQGLAACLRITVFGLLFGMVAVRLRRLRPGIVAHAVTDIVAGLTSSAR